MIRAISNFKPNSTNANSYNKHCEDSQLSFKGEEEIQLMRGYLTSGNMAKIEDRFKFFLRRCVNEDFCYQLCSRIQLKAVDTFLRIFRENVPNISDAEIARLKDDELNACIERRAPIS